MTELAVVIAAAAVAAAEEVGHAVALASAARASQESEANLAAYQREAACASVPK